MSGYTINIETATLENPHFRKVLFTTPRSQLVLMTLQAGEEIGAETHDDHDQFFRVEAGEGKAIVGNDTYPLADGVVVVVPAGQHHNVINTGKEPLRLYTLYMPPEHPDGIIHKTKAEADAYEAEQHG
ncbi:MAG TPA: cupin domain-containing protein [Myxococcaceae bacterium]|nr:cupin domain-containing protein [Myxococcaceae bacterium]